MPPAAVRFQRSLDSSVHYPPQHVDNAVALAAIGDRVRQERQARR